ncbi:Flp pilus assembly protein CpaB, partial [Myxococcota bacterium]|nr:Flp pilus assembly protein CpaB [Myxococcota bacterium]
PLTKDLVEVGEIPERLYTDSLLTQGDLEINVGRKLIHRIDKGQPIYFHNFEDNDKSLGQKIRPGGRGYSIMLNPGLGVGAWLKKTDHVDVIATVLKPGDAAKEKMSVTLLENISVLMVSENLVQRDSSDTLANPYTSVTLLLLPEEVELLHLAQVTGELSLSLRNPDDRGLQEKRSVTTIDSLLTRKRVDTVPLPGQPAFPQKPAAQPAPTAPTAPPK